MKKLARKIVNDKRLSAVFIVMLTVVYLLSTAAFAQDDTLLSENNIFNLEYTRDHLSYGDVWAFNESLYTSSRYVGPGEKSYEYYSNESYTNNTKLTANFNTYFGTLSFANRTAATGTPVSVIPFAKFSAGYVPASVASSVEGCDIDIPTVKLQEGGTTATYTVVPHSKGDYRVYVYSKDNPPTDVGYYLIDSYGDNNDFANDSNRGNLTFEQVEGTNWWYATVNVSAIGWKAAYPTCSTREDALTEGQEAVTSDEFKSSKEYTGTPLSDGSLLNSSLNEGGETATTTYYVNTWNYTEVQFNTLLVLQWSGDIQLGPISKVSSISVTTDTVEDDFTGTATLTNVFGETFTATAGVATWTTAHAPFTVVPEAADGSVFDGYNGISFTDGWYHFEDGDTLEFGLKWSKFYRLPEITVTGGGKEKPGDFYGGNYISVGCTMGAETKFTIKLDFNVADVDTAAYVISEYGAADVTGTVTKDAEGFGTIEVTAKSDNVTIVVTTETKDGQRNCTISIVPELTGVSYLVQNITQKATYQCIEDALAIAKSGDTIVLLGDVSFRADNPKNSWMEQINDAGDLAGYTVKEGVTLLLPYAKDQYTVNPSSHKTLPYANNGETVSTYASLDPQDEVYVTLTVPEGITLQNNGIVVVGGTIDGVSKQSYAGVCSGAHSNLELNGTLNMGNSSVLSVVGYIIGDGTIHATTQNGGAKIYHLFSVMDFKGGYYCLAAAGKVSGISTPAPTFSGESLIAAFNRFAFLGIQTEMVIKSGNNVYGYCDLYADSQHNMTTTQFIGTDASSSLIALTGGAELTVTYDPNRHLETMYDGALELAYDKIGKTTISITGGATLGSITLSVNVKGYFDMDVSSKNATFNIPFNFDVELLGGTYTIENDMALLPGATMTVGNGATVNVSKRFHVYPGLVDARAHSGSKDVTSNNVKWEKQNYPTTTQLQCESFGGNGSANLIIASGGRLNLNSGSKFSGLVQATGTGGTLYVESGATVSGAKHQFGAAGQGVAEVKLFGLKYTAYVSGACLYDGDGSIIDPATGNITALSVGTYTSCAYSSAVGSYTYTMYTSSADTTATTIYTEALGAAVQGAWYKSGTALDTGVVGSADGAVAKVVKADRSEVYYSSLPAAVAAARTGENVVLLADITLAQPVNTEYDIIINLNGHGVTCTNGLLTNSAAVTLELGNSTITGGTTIAPAIVNLGGAALTLNTGTGSILWGGDTGTEFAAATSVIVNYGDMAISGSGSISIANWSSSGIAHTGHTIRFAAVVRNEGTLSISGITLNATQITNSNSAAIINHKATISAISNVTINNAGGYAIYNLGGTIDTISGGSYAGTYGIINQNISGGNNSVGDGLFVTHEAKINSIRDTQVEVTGTYALINYATIGTIGGNASFTAPKLAIYNTAGWFYNVNAYKVVTIDGVKHTYYSLDKLPTIGLITDDVCITVTGSKVYAIQNTGCIGTINGNVKIIAGSITDAEAGTYTYTGYGLYVHQTGQVGEISGNVSVNALQYGVRVNSFYYTETYAVTDANGVKTTYYVGVKPAAIQTITDSVSITTSSTYGLYLSDGGYVDTISGNVSITASGSALVITGQAATKTQTWTTAADAEGNYQVVSVTFSDLHSQVGQIMGDTAGNGVVITASSADYAITNSGSIGSIGGKVGLTSGKYTAVYNNPTPAYAKYTYIRYYANDAEYQRDWNYDYDYEHASRIGSIGGNDGDVITISAPRYGIYNAGYIGLIGKGVTVSAKGNYGAIYNYPERRLSKYGTGTWETITGFEDTSADGKIQNTVYWTYTFDAENYPATIEIIDGATITNTKNYAINNCGYIGVITNCTISAANSSIYNNPSGPYDGKLIRVACYTHTSVTTSTSYDNVAETILSYTRKPSRIDVIDNSTITATTRYAVNNCGYIGYIQKSTIKAKADTIHQGDASTMSYKVMDEEYLVRGATGKFSFVSSPTTESNYQLAEIGTIGAGNTIQSTNSSTVGPAINNSGIIGAIDATVKAQWTVTDGVVKTITAKKVTDEPTLIIATYSSGIKNFGGHETSTAATEYESAKIGYIKNVSIVGKTYGIVNGDGESSAYSVTIGEIGEGVVAVATDATGYGLYNADQYATITLISGGDYYSGAKVRDYAIYNHGAQNYPTICHMLSMETRSVTVNGKTYACYYIVANHDWKNSVCQTCNFFEFYASNVRLGNSLEMMFAFPAAGLQGDLEGYYVKAVRTYADGSHEVVTYYYGQPFMTVVLTSVNGEVTTQTLKQNAWRTTTIDNVTYHVISYNRFAAKEMCDSISVSVCKKIDEEEKVFSAVWEDSIQDYTMRLLEDHMGSKPTLCRLLVDMLNYGAACQTHFAYNTDNLANAKLTAGQAACGTQNAPEYSDDFAADREQNNNGYWSSSTVIADTNSQFAVAFNKFTEGMYFTYTLTNHWDKAITKVVNFDEMTSPGLYHELANLRIADARHEITITVYDASNNVLGTWSDSIEAYCTRMINAADDDAQKAVYIELLKFADSAKAYLHSDEVLP